MGNQSRSLRLASDAAVTGTEVYQFQCGHEECDSQFMAPTINDLMPQVAQHLRDAHSVDRITDTLMNYLESTCVTVRHV